MKRLAVLFVLLALLLTGCELPEKTQSGSVSGTGLTVHYIDVGQADSILLQCDGEAMLIDGGNVADSQTVVSYLQRQGVEELSYVVNTHAHEDHVGGLAGVLAVFEADAVWCPVTEYESQCFADFVTYTQAQGLSLTCPAPGSVFSLGEAQVTVLGPLEAYDDPNNTSIVLRVDYGETSFLFTGDMERTAEEDLLDDGAALEADVLKAGHHGSDTSSSYPFLRAVDPEAVVISVGADNSYNHPGEDALSRFRDLGAAVYRTDLQGDVVVTSDGAEITFSTEREAAVTNPTEYDGSGQFSGGTTYIGNVNSQKFHLPTCSSLPAPENQTTFSSYDAAVEAGYSPCSRCLG